MHKFSIQPVLGTDPADGLPAFGFEVQDLFVTDPHRSPCGRFEADPVEQYAISKEDAKALETLNRALKDATDDAVNAGCLAIQKALGVQSGDVAGMFFSGGQHAYAVASVLAEYAQHELARAKTK